MPAGLRQSQTMEAIGQLTGGMAKRFRRDELVASIARLRARTSP